jgi:hypothetical protein
MPTARQQFVMSLCGAVMRIGKVQDQFARRGQDRGSVAKEPVGFERKPIRVIARDNKGRQARSMKLLSSIERAMPFS